MTAEATLDLIAAQGSDDGGDGGASPAGDTSTAFLEQKAKQHARTASILSDLSSPTQSFVSSSTLSLSPPLSPMSAHLLSDQRASSIFPRNKSIALGLSDADDVQQAAVAAAAAISTEFTQATEATNGTKKSKGATDGAQGAASAAAAAAASPAASPAVSAQPQSPAALNAQQQQQQTPARSDAGVGAAPAHNFFLSQESDVWREQARREIEEQIIREYSNRLKQEQDKQPAQVSAPFALGDVLVEIREGVESIVRDSFSACFEQRPPQPWNFNPALFVFWCIGVSVRYCVVFPVRFAFYLLFMSTFAIIFTALAFLPESKQKTKWFRFAIEKFAQVWLISLCCVVRYHGLPPVRRKNQIYVANHTSLNDYVVMGAYRPFAAVGQKHDGFVGLMQRRVVAPLNNIFFERFETRDRRLVAERMKKHIGDPEHNPPLLIFPEGVCVNNEYCVLFKKGVFELEDVEICPVAIRYNKLFSDPYWSSKDESYLTHIMRLMKSWCTVADVYFLEPQKLQQGESPIQFAGRVQRLIAERAGLKNLEWDGYLKYFQASDRLVKEKQKQIAMRLKPKFERLIGQPIQLVQQKRPRTDDDGEGGDKKNQ